MTKGNYQIDLREFWENRRQAREKRDRQLAELPFSDKVAITESLQRDAKAIRTVTSDSIELWVTSPDAVNHLGFDCSFTKDAFIKNLKKVSERTDNPESAPKQSKI